MLPSASHFALYFLLLPILALVCSIALGVIGLAFREPWTAARRMRAAQRTATPEDGAVAPSPTRHRRGLEAA